MTTPAALAEARHAQAAADLQAAQLALLTIMTGIDARLTLPIVDGILPRRFEMLLEGANPHRELAQAYSAFRRAQRAEAKARSAAYRAALPPPLAAPSKPKPAPKSKKPLPQKMTFAAYLDARAA